MKCITYQILTEYTMNIIDYRRDVCLCMRVREKIIKKMMRDKENVK